MTILDTLVDALEDQIAKVGVLHVDLERFAPADVGTNDRSKILVEMLRVWMEHRWQSGHPVTADECLEKFPNDTFGADDLEALRFEEQRQYGLSKQNSTSRNIPVRSIEELPTTSTLWGGFELLSILGTGAFAKVYLARQQGLAGRLVALKLTFRQTHESQWLATLQHSAIVPIYSIHQVDDVYGICMPYLGNTTLADLMREVPESTIYPKRSWWRSTRSKNRDSGRSLLNTIQARHDQIDTILDTIQRPSAKSPDVRTQANAESPAITSTDTPKNSLGVLDSLDYKLHASTLGQPTSSSPAARNLSQCSYVQAICWIGAQLADALSYAHRNGIMHSDVKPANILLASDGQPRILDFNVSYYNADSTLVTSETPLGGTVAYMSPEHLRAFDKPTVLDPRSDIYSLGVVLFEMLTCRLPKQGNRRSSTKAKADLLSKSSGAIDTGLEMRPSHWNPAVPPGLSAIVAKCLEHDSNDRYADAQQLFEDLTAQFNYEPLVHLPQPSWMERVTKWCHLHPRLSSSFTIASMATILVALLVSALWIRGAALEHADWVHRKDMLAQRLPNSLAMLSSLPAIPEIEAEVFADLNRNFELISTSDKQGAKLDPRWSAAKTSADKELQSLWQELVWSASQHPWKVLPACLAQNDNSKDRTPGIRQQAIDEIAAGRWMQASALLQQSIHENPRDFVAWCLVGHCQSALRDPVGAEKAYTVCISLNPASPVAFYNRGRCRSVAGLPELANQDFQVVQRLAPQWYWSYLNRALELQKMGRFQEAIAQLDEAIEKGYQSVSIYRLRAELNGSLGRTDEVFADTQLALQCTPVTDAQWIDRGLIRLSFNPEDAISDFQEALNLNPRSANAHQKLAHVYSEYLQNNETSLEHSDKLIALEPLDPSHRAGRAVLLARLGKEAAALEDVKMLESSTGLEPIAEYQIACVYSLLAGAVQGTADESKTSQFGESAFRWTIQAAKRDPSIVELASTDPDVAWMREQSKYQEIQNAFKTLQLTAPLPSTQR